MRKLLLVMLVIAACDGAAPLTAPDLSFSVVSGDGQSGTVGQTAVLQGLLYVAGGMSYFDEPWKFGIFQVEYVDVYHHP